jgi:hypothetical protein
MAKPTREQRKRAARVHVAQNLLALIHLAEDGRDGGWAHRYTPAEMEDSPELAQTSASDIAEALDEIKQKLERWLP